jgi:DNA repair protein RadA/Sms
MSKEKTMYICESCGNETTKWAGKCPHCGDWNSLSEIKFKQTKSGKKAPQIGKDTVQKLKDITETNFPRIETGISEFDRVMGGESFRGIVPGSVTLIAGEPGIGKSTLVLQILSELSKRDLKSLYLSGEESAQQIKIRSNRLKSNDENIFLLNETDVLILDKVMAKEKADLLVVDSIQTVENSNFENSPGSVTQIKESASYLIRLAKKNHIPLFIIGHITKGGTIAGPKILEHLVDTVLYFEGERFHSFRILRAIKNRFGAVSEIGVFEMRDNGLLEIKNPSEFFISSHKKEPGSSVAVTLEGTRPILAEIQTLISKTSYGYPKRTAGGYDLNRLQILIAVLSRALRVPLNNLDVYLNIAGGLKVKEPSLDLAVCISIISSYKKKKVHDKMAFIGEIGLLGELRPVSKTKERIKEAEKLGFDHVVVPKGTESISANIQIIEARNIAEAVSKSLEA